VEEAKESISSGRAYGKLKGLIDITHGDQSKLERIEAANA
jgi:hypothetical protein